MKISFDIGDSYGKLLDTLLAQVNVMRAKQNVPPVTMDQWAKLVFVNAVAQDVANVEASS